MPREAKQAVASAAASRGAQSSKPGTVMTALRATSSGPAAAASVESDLLVLCSRTDLGRVGWAGRLWLLYLRSRIASCSLRVGDVRPNSESGRAFVRWFLPEPDTLDGNGLVVEGRRGYATQTTAPGIVNSFLAGALRWAGR